MPTASVHDRGTSSPITWPPTTPSMPKWNSGEPEPQQPVLVELRGPGGPAELVVAVAPDVADDEDRQAQVGDDDPEEGAHRGAPTGMVADEIEGGSGAPGRGRRRSPRGRPPRPAAPARRDVVRRRPRRPARVGRVSHRASSAAAHGDPVVPSSLRQPVSASRSISTPARWSRSSRHAASASTVAPNCSTAHRWSGSSPVARPTRPRRAVGLLEVHQRHPAAPGVAVREVGEVERALAGVVEGGDVLLLEQRQRRASRRWARSGARCGVAGHQRLEVVERRDAARAVG